VSLPAVRVAVRALAAPALLLALLSAPAPRRADDALAKIDEAKAAIAAKQGPKAYLALSNAISELAARTPLFLTAGALVDGPSRGYGQYTTRPHNVYTRNQPIQVYVEPAGFDHGRKAGGLYTVSLACDYQILDSKGKIVTADRVIKEVEIVSRQANAELGVDIAMPLLDLPKGDYTLEIQVRDQIANDSARVKLPFKMQ
jgi:hypothetical protein